MAPMGPPPDLVARFGAAGQGQVFRFWDRLDAGARAAFAAELAAVPDDCLTAAAPAPAPAATPEPADAVDEATPAALGEAATHAARGEAALRAGEVAAVLLAGGDGTRLGHPGPKGSYPIGPATGKTLYQWFAEQVVARGRRAGRPIPLVILTSPSTHDATAAYFAAHDRFGLSPSQCTLVRQGTRPVRDPQGRLLLRGPGALVRAPDGHGGLVVALAAGPLDSLAAAGVQHCFVFQVDNPLVPVCDPGTIGRHLAAGTEATSRAIRKERPEEPHGVFCRRNGRLAVWEYTELPPEAASRRAADGGLAFRAANIAVHVLTVDFLRRMARDAAALPWHGARKPVRVVGEDGTAEAATATGEKQERFLFDILPRAERPLLLMGARDTWFAPAKTADGEFSGLAARAALGALHARWAAAAGLPVTGRDGGPLGAVEVSPLLALDAAELAVRAPVLGLRPPLRFPLAIG